jgi:DNA repair exonuclease SbcCD ATPase subunit
MTNPNGAIDHATRRHAHSTQSEPERCPLCGNKISPATRTRLDEKLRAQLAKAEQTLRDQFARQQQQAVAKAATEVAKAKANAAAEVEQVRREATKAAAAALQPKIAEAVAQAVRPSPYFAFVIMIAASMLLRM